MDSLADQVVTSIGVATYAKMDIDGAIKEVNRSNYSKFDLDDNSKFILLKMVERLGVANDISNQILNHFFQNNCKIIIKMT